MARMRQRSVIKLVLILLIVTSLLSVVNFFPSTAQTLIKRAAADSYVGDQAERKKAISEDMQRCSLALGMSPGVLSENRDKVDSIAEKAAFFLETLREVVPKKFLPEFKNPCWYSDVTISKNMSKFLRSSLPAVPRNKATISPSDLPWVYSELYESHNNERTLYCLPHFLLPGIPKSGTTTLHSALSHHPQIMMPAEKEPQWWYKVPLNDKKYLKAFIARYLVNFMPPAMKISAKKGGVSLITYDASQTMMVNVYDSSFHVDSEDYCALPAMIARVLPNAKIVVVMRDPVSRLYSHYLYMHGRDKGEWPHEMRLNPPMYFHNKVKEAVLAFEECLKEEVSTYECVNGERTNFVELRTWLGVGVYYMHLHKWMQFWPMENFLFLKMEDMVKNPPATMRNITQLLSLEPSLGKKSVVWFYKKKNTKSDSSPKNSMLPETRQLLQAFYEPHNKKLEELVGINWTYKT